MLKCLYLPFDLMVELSAIVFPFNHNQGIVMKVFNLILVATKKWVSESGTAI